MTDPRFLRAAFGLAAVVTLIGIARFEGPAVAYWDTYIASPALHLAGQEVDFVLRDGSPLISYSLSGALPEDLIDRDTFGIITKDQRLGAGVVAAPAYAALGIAGFRLLHGLLCGLTALGGVLLGRAVFGRPGPALLVGTALALNPYTLSVNRLNPNVFALAGVVVLLALCVRRAPWTVGRAALIGALFGAVGNIRPELILGAPALAVAILRVPEQRWVRAGASVLAAGVLILPTLVWSSLAFGDPLMHSSQFGAFEGFRPTFPHALGPLTFEFNGLLNVPFHDRLVRTPHFPFPIYAVALLLPLITWGALACAVAGLGAITLARAPESRFGAGVVGLFTAPLLLLLLPMENWDELKMTYSLLWFPGLAVAFAAGADAGLRAARERDPRVLVGVVATAAALVLGQLQVRGWEVPADPRWYERFPGAGENGSGITLLDDTARRDWEYFHTRESPEEWTLQRRRFTRANLLPARYWSAEPDAAAGLARAWTELGDRELEVLAVWYYIYGGRRDDVDSP